MSSNKRQLSTSVGFGLNPQIGLSTGDYSEANFPKRTLNKRQKKEGGGGDVCTKAP